MKRRVISKPFFQARTSHSYLSLFRTDFICDMANSKLCFLLHETSSAAKNACPTRGENTLRSRLFLKIISGND
jgi:hypothetical protein